MNISIVLPNLMGGGAERLHINLAKYWTSLGHSVEFVLLDKSGELLGLLPKEVTIHELKSKRIFQSLIPLIGYLRRKSPDVTISAMWPLTTVTIIAWLFSMKKGKLFVSDHTHLTNSRKEELKIPYLFLKLTIALTYPLATRIIAVSEGVRRDISKIGSIPKKRISTIYNPVSHGIPLKRISRDESLNIWKDTNSYRILSVGSLIEQKNFRYLIDSFSLLVKEHEAQLIILGEGPQRQLLEDQISSLNLEENITLRGFEIDTYPFYQSADIFVLSSKWEGFGNVIVESLECGLPVVSVDCQSGPSEILLNGKFGKLINIKEDPLVLSQAILSSLKTKIDPEFLYSRSKDFRIDSIGKEYINLFKAYQGS